ncbi:MAG TPA: DUF4153 domain-containing protein [Patescibacteria group bacterium]|nr:DUF4153 domain-containing protein [Patescibacteria group bacterium]
MAGIGFLKPPVDLRQTVVRFAPSILCSIVCFLLTLVLSHDSLRKAFDLQGSDRGIYQVIYIFVCGYFWFGSVRLLAESRQWPARQLWSIAVGVYAGIAILLSLSPQWELHLMFIGPALLLFLMVAPYTQKSADEFSFWNFNRLLWTGATVSFAVSILLAMALCAILGSIEYLFDLKDSMNRNLYGDSWLFCSMLFCPVFTLFWVPRGFTFKTGGFEFPAPLRFFIVWILAPLVVVYFLILYAYTGLILIHRELPKGNLAYMITGFGGAGMLLQLVAWPLREGGSRFLNFVLKYFYPALVVPVVMLFVSIGTRISEYGITEQRYAIVLVGLWFCAMVAAFISRREKLSPRLIPAVALVLAIAASFGPWGAVSVSGRSQLARLHDLLVRHGLLVDGHIVEAKGAIPFADQKNISSLIDYIRKTERASAVIPWFPKNPEADNSFNSEAAMHAMGLKYIGEWQEKDNGESIYLRGDDGQVTAVTGYDYVVLQTLSTYGSINNSTSGAVKISANGSKGPSDISFQLKDGILNVRVEGHGALDFDLKSFIENRIAGGPPPYDDKPMVMDAEKDGLRLRLIVQNASVNSKDKSLTIESIAVRLLVGF